MNPGRTSDCLVSPRLKSSMILYRMTSKSSIITRAMKLTLQINQFVSWLVVTPVVALWPLPQVYERGSLTLWLSADVQYVYRKTDPPHQSLNLLWDQSVLLVTPKSCIVS